MKGVSTGKFLSGFNTRALERGKNVWVTLVVILMNNHQGATTRDCYYGKLTKTMLF